MLNLTLAALVSAAGAFAATVTYNVAFDTSPLVSNSAGPFALDFQFNDGDGANDNTVILSDFNFNGGASTGPLSNSGGASGSLATGVTITDSSFLNEFTQEFIPGTALDFTVSLTNNFQNGGIPDEFTFAVLDNSGFEIPALGNGDSFIVADINSLTPAVLTYASDVSRDAAASKPIELNAPVVTAAGAAPSAVPEPSTLLGLAGALLALAWRRSSREACE